MIPTSHSKRPSLAFGRKETKMDWLQISISVFAVLVSIISMILSVQANRMSRKAEAILRRGS